MVGIRNKITYTKDETQKSRVFSIQLSPSFHMTLTQPFMNPCCCIFFFLCPSRKPIYASLVPIPLFCFSLFAIFHSWADPLNIRAVTQCWRYVPWVILIRDIACPTAVKSNIYSEKGEVYIFSKELLFKNSIISHSPRISCKDIHVISYCAISHNLKISYKQLCRKYLNFDISRANVKFKNHYTSNMP